jgi:hypothetical protein
MTRSRSAVDSIRVGHPKRPSESRAKAAQFALLTILLGFAPLGH